MLNERAPQIKIALPLNQNTLETKRKNFDDHHNAPFLISKKKKRKKELKYPKNFFFDT